MQPPCQGFGASSDRPARARGSGRRPPRSDVEHATRVAGEPGLGRPMEPQLLPVGQRARRRTARPKAEPFAFEEARATTSRGGRRSARPSQRYGAPGVLGAVHADRAEDRGDSRATAEPLRDEDAADDLRAVRGLDLRPRLRVVSCAACVVVVPERVSTRHVERDELVLLRRSRRALRRIEDHVVRVPVEEDAEVRRCDRGRCAVRRRIHDPVRELRDGRQGLTVQARVADRAAPLSAVRIGPELDTVERGGDARVRRRSRRRGGASSARGRPRVALRPLRPRWTCRPAPAGPAGPAHLPGRAGPSGPTAP